MPTIDGYNDSPFAFKGWNRLVIVLCAAYLILTGLWAIVATTTERSEINAYLAAVSNRDTSNPYNKYMYVEDHPPSEMLWYWTPDVTSAPVHHLADSGNPFGKGPWEKYQDNSAPVGHFNLRVGLIAAVMFLPPLVFASIIFSGLWVYTGFRTST